MPCQKDEFCLYYKAQTFEIQEVYNREKETAGAMASN